jgi:macrolide transport system ATP-binding/permease protein
MAGLWQDIRYGIRSLTKHKGLTAVSLVVLGLGIGATNALFTLTNAVLLRPLSGVANPKELVRLGRIQNGQEYSNWSYPDYLDYRDQNHSMAGLIAERGIPIRFAHGNTERLSGAIVTGNYFEVLGVRVAAGRALSPGDERAAVAVISYSLWNRAFNGDPTAVGQKMLLNGYVFTIIGVVSHDFSGTSIGERTDVWVPMMMQREAMPRNANSNMLTSRRAGWLSIYGRLRPRISMEQAQADIATIAYALERAYPESNTGRSAVLSRDVGLTPGQRRDLQRMLGLLFGSVVLLLLIACQNVANLFLTRAAGRKREIAIRIAVGASRLRLIRQLLVESLLVGVAAGSLGFLVVPFIVSLTLLVLGPADAALRAPANVDGGVLLFSLGVTLGTALLFGLAPALQASKGPASVSSRTSRLASLLVVGQVAVSAVLLVAAGLLLQTMVRVLNVDRGFQTDRVLIAAADLAIQRYSESQGKQFCERLMQRLAALPEVESASLSKSEPARDWSDRTHVYHPGRSGELLVDANRVSPEYFRTLSMAIVDGRDFTWRDRDIAPRVAIVSEALAQRMWPGERAVGKHITEAQIQLEVVGVTRDAKYRSILSPPPLLLYTPWMQSYDSYVSLEIRTRNDPAAFARTLRREVAALDPTLPLYSIRTFKEQVDRSLWQQRSAAILVGAFGIIALILASLGLYNQLAHSVASRTREIGIRMALGADAPNVLRSILRQGTMLAAAGTVIGLVAAMASTKFVEGLLYGITARDPLTLGSVLLVLAVVTIVASYFPARAATQVDPMIALRQD